MFSIKYLTAAFLLAGSALAQTGNETVHVVQVGLDGNLTFSPNNVKANVGDFVQFQFWPKSHSVVQSTFAAPCVPIQSSQPNVTSAFFSGFMPTNRTASGPGSNTLTYTIQVQSSSPIWYYCSQAKHCQAGMVGAINAADTGDKTVAAFQALAAQAPNNITPGQTSNSTTNTGGSAASSTLATTTASSTGSSTSNPATVSGNAAPGALFDSVNGGMVGMVAAAMAFFLL